MVTTIFNITFDAVDPRRLAGFWSQVTGYAASFEADYLVRLTPPESGSPHLLFLQVDQPSTDKSRTHLDLDAADATAEAERLLGLGATLADPRGEDGSMTWRSAGGLSWLVFRDPEGNHFCLGSHSET